MAGVKTVTIFKPNKIYYVACLPGGITGALLVSKICTLSRRLERGDSYQSK